MQNSKSLRLISLAIAIAAALWAQSSLLRGKVTLAQRPLASASVSAYLLDAQQSKTVRQFATVTTSDGTFAMNSLPYGTYIVVVKYQGKIVYQTKLQLSTAAGQALQIALKA
jgi:hypothetical protein